MGIFKFFADAFGYILNGIYNIDFIKNYGVAIILFTIIVKLIILPITIKQQKTMKKTARIQEEVKKIQEKYKGNQQKINEETMAVYKRENMSPCSGCFSSIIQIVLLLSVFYLVSQPLTHMRKVDRIYTDIVIEENKQEEQINEDESEKQEETENQEENIVKEEVAEEKEVEKVNIVNFYKRQLKEEANNQKTMYEEINIIKLKGPQDERVYINMNFLGLDLSDVPSGDLSNIKVYIIPALYVITSIISIKITTKATKKKKEEEENKPEGEEDVDLASQMNKNMSFITPIMSVMIAMVAPLGLALYWLVNNILTIAERVIIDKFIIKREEE